MKIFLDDIRLCPRGFTLAINYDECIKLLSNNHVEVISLDHDLGEQYTGYDVVKFMVENEIYPSIIYLHSSNPVGVKNMYELLDRYAPRNVDIQKIDYWRSFKNDVT